MVDKINTMATELPPQIVNNFEDRLRAQGHKIVSADDAILGQAESFRWLTPISVFFQAMEGTPEQILLSLLRDLAEEQGVSLISIEPLLDDIGVAIIEEEIVFVKR